MLLRNLPYQKPEQLVRVGFVTDGIASPGDLHSAATYLHFAKGARSFAEIGAYTTNDDFNLTDGDAERVSVALMTPNTFSLLGVKPIIGGLFEPGDTSWTNGRTPILISENLWRRRYGADRNIIGRRIDINRGARDVIGVLPRSFDFPTSSIDIYYPVSLSVARPDITARGLNVIGRLRDGVQASQARAELNALIPSLSERFPKITQDMLRQSQARVVGGVVQDGHRGSRSPAARSIGSVGWSRAAHRNDECRQLVSAPHRASESRSRNCTFIGRKPSRARTAFRRRRYRTWSGIGGRRTSIVVVTVSTKFGFTEREIPRLHEVGFTLQSAMLVFGIAAVIGAAVGLMGLTRTGMVGLFDRLRAARSTSSRTWRRAQSALVAFQVATALVLLVAGGLLGRSFWNLRSAEIGFEPANAMMFQLSLPWGPDGYRIVREECRVQCSHG